MEKRINKQVEEFMLGFKNDIKNKVCELQFKDHEKANTLCEYIYEYDRIVIPKDDFTKRRRTQNDVPTTNRCIAKRANNEQCTRRRKNGFDYCGTHAKGTPNGSFEVDEKMLKKITVVAQVVNGIVYFIDEYSNVYKTEDIMNESEDPQIIAKYNKENDNISFL
jgi:hypothetical protein